MTAPRPRELAVNDGIRCIGKVVERTPDRAEAYAADGRALGVFTISAKAAHAIMDWPGRDGQ